MAPTFQAGMSHMSIVAGDFNEDGRPDLAVANSESDDVSILLADGPGHFATPVNYAASSVPSSIAAGDLNGDGKLDLAVANHFSVSIYLGNGLGGFDPRPPIRAGGDSCRSVAL